MVIIQKKNVTLKSLFQKEHIFHIFLYYSHILVDMEEDQIL